MKNKSMVIQLVVAVTLSGCATMPEGSVDDTSKLVDQITQSLKNLDQNNLTSAFESYQGKHQDYLYIKSSEYPYWSTYSLKDVRDESNQALAKLIKCKASMERSRLGEKDEDWRKCSLSQFRVLDRFPLLPKEPNRKEITMRFQDYEIEQKAANQKASLERAKLVAEAEKTRIAEQKHAEQMKEKDPNTWAERACNSQKLIDLSNDTIRREKAGANHSGVVNQRALYGAGQTIETMQEQQSQQKAEFKKLSGKNWSPSLCK